VLGAICWAATTWLHGWLFGAAFLVRVGVLFAVIAIAGGAYFGLCLLLRVEATQDALGAVLRKLRRRAG
jgi:hypothetical protein